MSLEFVEALLHLLHMFLTSTEQGWKLSSKKGFGSNTSVPATNPKATRDVRHRLDRWGTREEPPGREGEIDHAMYIHVWQDGTMVNCQVQVFDDI